MTAGGFANFIAPKQESESEATTETLYLEKETEYLKTQRLAMIVTASTIHGSIQPDVRR